MNGNQFFKSIKDGDIKSVYLLHGEEEYVKESAFNQLKQAVVTQFEELNLSIFDAASVDEIIASCDTMPMMIEKRMVLCRFIPKDAKKLTEYMNNISPYCVLVFMVHGMADGKTAVFKKIKELDGEVCFKYLNEDEAVRRIMQHATEAGCTVNSTDSRYMVQLVGKDVLSLKNELAKLCDYVGQGGVITKDIISNVVIKNLEFQLYSTYAYFTNGKMQDGMRSLDNIMNGKDRDSEAMGVAGYFLSCLKAALSAHDLLKGNASQAQLEQETGKRGYALRELCSTAKKFTRGQLLDGIIAFSGVAKAKIMQGRSSYDVLTDAVISTFSHIK